MNKCTNCSADFSDRYQVKYCSNQCQLDFQHKRWIKFWQNGKVNGNIGKTTRNISTHLKKYLRDKFENRCSQCGWAKKHPMTKIVPLDIDHIDGNAENNAEDNLRLLCPNCHALTPFYKNLNRGNGRSWRTKKYIRVFK